MKFKEFQQEIKRTLSNLDRTYHLETHDDLDKFAVVELSKYLLDIIHMRLGIISELEELITAIRKKDKINLGEELVDTLWYIGNDLNIALYVGFIDQGTYNVFADYELGKSPMVTDGGFKLEEEEGWLISIVFNASNLCDQTKKLLAYKKPVNVLEYTKSMRYLIGGINNLAISREINLEEYMDKVVDKLKARYPDKFDADKAINRDTAVERIILERGAGDDYPIVSPI